jgi:hypothetical protein
MCKALFMCNALLMSHVPLFFMGFVMFFLAYLFVLSVLVLSNGRYGHS